MGRIRKKKQESPLIRFSSIVSPATLYPEARAKFLASEAQCGKGPLGRPVHGRRGTHGKGIVLNKGAWSMENGIESHEEYAARIAGIPVEHVTPEQRRAVKELRIFTVYGGNPAGRTRFRCLTEADFPRAHMRLFREGQRPSSVLMHNFARQESAAFAIHAQHVQDLVQSGAEILPGSTFSDLMVSVPLEGHGTP